VAELSCDVVPEAVDAEVELLLEEPDSAVIDTLPDEEEAKNVSVPAEPPDERDAEVLERPVGKDAVPVLTRGTEAIAAAHSVCESCVGGRPITLNTSVLKLYATPFTVPDFAESKIMSFLTTTSAFQAFGAVLATPFTTLTV